MRLNQRTAANWLIIITLAGTLLGFVRPKLYPSALARRERAAISAIREIVEAERQFAAETRRYATLAELVAAGKIDQRLAAGTTDGYRIEISPELNRYVVIAQPIEFPLTGHRAFYSDETGVIRFILDGRLKPDSQSPILER